MDALVGRDQELDALKRSLDEACSGSARFVIVTGEPGIGKTSLLAELQRRAEQRRCLVLEGSAAELERELPFGVVVDAFDEYVESLDPRAFSGLAHEDLGELARVFPALRSLDPGSDPPSTPAERFRAHRAVCHLIERLAARQPLVLLLDDLQWATPTTSSSCSETSSGTSASSASATWRGSRRGSLVPAPRGLMWRSWGISVVLAR